MRRIEYFNLKYHFEINEGKKFPADDFISLPAQHAHGTGINTGHTPLFIEGYDSLTRRNHNIGQFLLADTFDEI